jgi:hypothetical protein
MTNQEGNRKPKSTISLNDNVVERAGEKTFSWSDAAGAGDCIIQNASITIRPDGTASWHAQVLSTGGGDAYCVTLSFHDRNDLVIVQWPRFCSQTLTGAFQDWDNNNLAIPQAHFNFITSVSRRDHC